MRRTDFSRMRCPVASAMAVLGERWTMLILREAFAGTSRFEAFARNLGIAPNILSARLAEMVEHGRSMLASGLGDEPGEGETSIKRGYLGLLHARDAIRLRAEDVAAAARQRS